jgi:cell division protein ZapE
LSIREAYEKSLRREGHVRDAAQESIVALLEDLQQRLNAARPRRHGLFGFFRSAVPANGSPVRGLYLWGGVGRGKTFLMDLFFETLEIESKRRIHFHRMMRDVHSRLRKLDQVEDPLDAVAADIAASTTVLCFDEFFVSDIGDAMILARLLDGLFRRGVTLVATSNTPPGELYRDGLQRQQFLAAIELLETHTEVVHIAGDLDYRLRLLERAGTYLAPDDAVARLTLAEFFDDSASSDIEEDRMLEINGRDIRACRAAKGIAWFEFADLCEGPRSQDDYIEIARWYPAVIVSGVPVLDETRDNEARRFIALVDEFYDRRVKLIVSAETEVGSLYTGRRLAFEFERTVSRLIEMQSTAYLAAPHLA